MRQKAPEGPPCAGCPYWREQYDFFIHFRLSQILRNFLTCLLGTKHFPHLTNRGTDEPLHQLFSLGQFVPKLRPLGRRQLYRGPRRSPAPAGSVGRGGTAERVRNRLEPVAKNAELAPTRVWGGSPTSVFVAPSGYKNSKCGHTCPAYW